MASESTPGGAMQLPRRRREHRNTMQHHDPVGIPGGQSRVAPAALESRLTIAENVLATLAVDLDARTSFRTRPAGAHRHAPAGARRATAPWRDWPLATPGLALQLTRPRRRRHARPDRRPAAGWRAGATRWPQQAGGAAAASSCSSSQRAAASRSATRRTRRCRRRRCRRSREAADAALDLGAAAAGALRPALPQAAARRLPADAGLDRRDAGAALPDHPADGRHPDPVPERPADRARQGGAVPGRPAGARRWPAGGWAGRAPTCWRWCPSASAPTCAPPPTSTC